VSLTTTVAALAAAALATSGPTVTITAPGHTPTIKTRWNYRVTVMLDGRPAAARITEQIVDPVGGVHAVQRGTSTKNITNLAIKGSYKDFIIWPAESRGIPLTFRVKITAGGKTKVDDYNVVPKG
jgi:hypothetical protein